MDIQILGDKSDENEIVEQLRGAKDILVTVKGRCLKVDGRFCCHLTAIFNHHINYPYTPILAFQNTIIIARSVYPVISCTNKG